MAWTTPATFTSGNVLTAAQMNTNVRDNTNYLFDQPMAAVQSTVNRSMVDATDTQIQFGTTIYSSPGITVATSTLTPTTAGAYETWVQATWTANATGNRGLAILNFLGVQYDLVAQDIRATPGSGRCSQSISAQFLWASGAMSCRGYQNSGGALNLLADGTASAAFTNGNETLRFGIKMLGTGS